jgi:hypothetical protein
VIRHTEDIQKLTSELNIDWFFFENRIHKLNIEILEPIMAM